MSKASAFSLSQKPRYPYRSVHGVCVFGTQTRGCYKPFQHLLFYFHHLCFFFLSIKTTVITTCVSSSAWTNEELVSMAPSVWMKGEYIAELLRNDERHVRRKKFVYTQRTS